ncbi:NO-binding membrane sensor protein with MHYT domain [Streptomyces pseudovenezuelae]|uniref:NO-binding membrane sensor protein with MHYT domain n=1 Tax=Streptomyces pseudovenezuelae TaxID=67350 RepID=A0ABT6LVU3_9ACTN|nr:NO-binding membrane sensor protein with MHYT domain [Streptomyces pseudovenezuelae]
MNGTIDGFRYGAVTPVAAYLMACLGGALGLRCIVRSLLDEESWKPGWLALGAASIGCGIWTMHFIAMLGFQVEETGIRYNVGLTVLSLGVAIVVVAIGVFIVGYLGAGRTTLAVAGVITGLGVAAMHYLGMAAMQLNGDIQYSVVTVALSVLIAIVAATAALWAAVSIRGFLTSLAASLVMGIAVSGMHYTGMAAVAVHVHSSGNGSYSGDSPTSLLLPMLLGPAVFLLLAGVVVMFDPLLVLGDGEWNRNPSASSRRSAGKTSAADDPAEGPGARSRGTLFDRTDAPARPGPDAHASTGSTSRQSRVASGGRHRDPSRAAPGRPQAPTGTTGSGRPTGAANGSGAVRPPEPLRTTTSAPRSAPTSARRQGPPAGPPQGPYGPPQPAPRQAPPRAQEW